jgi:hypothetical protein
MSVFAKRIVSFARSADKLPRCGNDGLSQSLQRIDRVKQTHVIRSHRGWQQRATVGEHITFFQRQVEYSFELVERFDAMP